MNKLAMVLTVAAAATFTGCKDPQFNRGGALFQDGASNVETAKAEQASAADESVATAEKPAEEATPDQKISVVEKGCKCPAGTSHDSPCSCGAADCDCIVNAKAAEKKAPEQEYSIYVVQNGDYLAKISKKYNVTIAAIKRANDLKDDKIRIGQKLKIPGKLPESSVAQQQSATAAAPAAKPAPQKSFVPYTGETKEYVVKSGDTLGAIAYSHGINIRQLKDLNGLSSDVLRINQKLKVPAVVKSAAKTPAKTAEKSQEPAKVEPAATSVENSAADATAVETNAVQEVAEDKHNAQPVYEDYVVQETDDILGLSIKYNLTTDEIRSINNLPAGAQLSKGQIIKLPQIQE